MELQPGFVAITRKYESKSKWFDIAKRISEGNNGYLNLGDVITDKLKDGREFSVEVVALNSYSPNTVVLAFKELPALYAMNDEATNRGGWEACKMRRYLNGDFFDLLPDDLQEVIRARTIKQLLNNRVVTTLDKLWLMSRTEIFGQEWQTDVDDVQFEWFKEKAHRVKFYNGEPYPWRERSPNYNNTNTFCFVNTNGHAGNSDADYSYGVAPAFILGS